MHPGEKQRRILIFKLQTCQTNLTQTGRGQVTASLGEVSGTTSVSLQAPNPWTAWNLWQDLTLQS